MFQQVGKFLLEAREKGPARIAMVIAIFMIFGAYDFVVEWVISVTQTPIAAHGAIDGIIVGGLAAFLAWFFMEAARREKARIRAELEKEARLNHEIRNALEVIAQAGYLTSDLNLKSVVSESVNRIDSILKERKPPES